MKTIMFPGQGSQYRGMGGTLFDEFPQLTARADEVLGYSVKQLCLEDPLGQLGKTQYTQPALYVANALAYTKATDNRLKPDYLAGHSLGEYNALLAAGCFDFETGLRLVQKRGELMSQAAGGEQIHTLLHDHGLFNVDLANYNSPSQIVISGAIDEIRKAESIFTGTMKFYPLNTSGAFHSRFMAPARKEFHDYLQTFELADPTLPVISNVAAKPYEPGDVAINLAAQVTSTVRWYESVRFLLNVAASARAEMEFVEIGGGDVLTKLVNAIKLQEPPRPVTTPVISKLTAVDKVRQWNSRYPVGTRVKAVDAGEPGQEVRQDKEFETRTEAMVLFGHRAAVYMKGFNGYFSLDEVRAP
jgi:malonyl CoA-acyl carrier protein transacylase